jgi:hypothetical protein
MVSLNPLHLPPTEDTPEVRFDAEAGVLSISGRSLPENAWQFYQALVEWTRNYCARISQPTRVELHLDYFNSSSGRYLFEILTIIEQQARDRTSFRVIWKADRDDELMIEKGEELKSLVDLPFEIQVG